MSGVPLLLEVVLKLLQNFGKILKDYVMRTGVSDTVSTGVLSRAEASYRTLGVAGAGRVGPKHKHTWGPGEGW